MALQPARSFRLCLVLMVLGWGLVAGQTPPTASWPGINSDFTLEPPDPHGAAGPDGILQVVNVRMEYWDKAGQPIWGPVPLDGFFASVGNRGFSFDPHAQYDPGAGRFYVTLLEQDTANKKSYVCLAVSKSSHPASGTSADWFVYRLDNTRTNDGLAYWGDYPGLGFDYQAIYVTVNLYTFNDVNGDAEIIVLDKQSALNGTARYKLVFASGGSDDGFTLQPCTVRGNNAPTNVAYFAETPFSSTSDVRIWALRDPLGAATLDSTRVRIPDNGGSAPASGAPQPGTAITLDALDQRTQGNAFWLNGSIWFCHTAGGDRGKAVVHYYKVDLNDYPLGKPSLGEAGMIDGGDGEWTFQPSIGGNPAGDVCLVFSQSSFSRPPAIFAALRKAGAAAFDPPILIKASPGFYFGYRWGDFGSVTPDPADDSFWVTHEWARSTSLYDWGTWWANLQTRPAPRLVIETNYLAGGNGNGILDPNECNQLTLVLTNRGSLGATNVQLAISTGTPGVAIGVRNSSCPDLPVASGGSNLVAFTISMATNFVCGTPVTFTVVARSDQGATTNQLRLDSGIVGSPVRFDSVSPVVIPDESPAGTNSIITVSNVTTAIARVTISLYLKHTYDSDLTLRLVAPDGASCTLAANRGGLGDNYGMSCSPDSMRTTFDDEAVQSLANGGAPFVGNFRPDSPLAVFMGKHGTNINGEWKLQVVDSIGADVGVLNCWSLFITPSLCHDGGGVCPGTDLAIGLTGAPSPVFIGSNLVFTITVTNLGPGTAKQIVVQHSLPGSVVFVSAVSSRGRCFNEAGTVVCKFGKLRLREEAKITVTVVPMTKEVISSIVTVSSKREDPDTGSNFAAAMVTVNSRVSVPAYFSEVAVTNGQLQATLTGEPGQPYVLQASTNLLTWTPILTNTAGANGTIKFTDANAPSFGFRFYRSVRLIP